MGLFPNQFAQKLSRIKIKDNFNQKKKKPFHKKKKVNPTENA